MAGEREQLWFDAVGCHLRDRSGVGKDRPVLAAVKDDSQSGAECRVGDQPASVDAAFIKRSWHELAEQVDADQAGDGDAQAEPSRAAGSDRAGAAYGQSGPVD